MCPEKIMMNTYDNKKVDIFSLGVILFVMRTQFYPFESADIEEDKCYNSLVFKPKQFWNSVDSS